ncbi:hypothetical protein MTX78_02945 [Hymenobacter tibetensis]|uniref:CcmD family protein n=1 Tax=Hymenobacter tibetensis TaxID=497967 RepID=A0ABY4CZQ8_9BACT|nr:hypothetical protein [Hymenobacter tibetensis]UOG75556.1 hypothetical protein MTX78_02945 [Hymenobacter tibetensis]
MKNSLFNQSKSLANSGALQLRLRKSALLLLALLLPALQAVAQTTDTPEMADAFRSDGKIYVVVAVVTVVLAGLLAFLVSLDRKVTRLERELKD